MENASEKWTIIKFSFSFPEIKEGRTLVSQRYHF
jgi:hypothetical protein